MKQKLLLVSAMLTLSATAFAEGWEKPVWGDQPQASELALDGTTEQYLYNVGAESFFRGANNWMTRATLDPAKGYKVKISVADEASKTYILTDYVETKKAWFNVFTDGLTSMWVDNNTGANYNKWQFDVKEDGTFNILNAAHGSEYLLGGRYEDMGKMGADGATAVGIYLNFFKSADGAETTWIAVSAEDYDAFIGGREARATEMATKKAIYLAAVTLGDAITAAQTKYPELDLSTVLAVYNNLSSTEAQLNDAVTALNKLVADYEVELAKNTASATNPVDFSSMIVNGTFDKVGDFTGWGGSSFGAGGSTSTCAERYQMTFDTYQTLENLPLGVYRVNVDGFYRAGSTPESYLNYVQGLEKNVKLYAVSDPDYVFETDIMNIFADPKIGDSSLGGTTHTVGDITYYVPNSMLDFTKFNEAGHYKTNEVMLASIDGKIKIGVKSTSSLGWTIVDNFGLTFYGNGADAYAMWMQQYVNALSNYENVKVSDPVRTDYQNTIANYTDAASYDDVKANMAAIKAAIVLIEENAAAWAELEDAYNEATKLTGELTGEYTDLLSDYLMDVEDYMNDLSLSTESLKAIIATLTKMADDARSNDLEDGADITKYIVNNDFASGWSGWTHEAVAGGNVAANSGAKCAEGWNNGNFDIYQVIKAKLPVGIYEIQVQGFYRRSRGDKAWSYYFDEFGEPKENAPESPAYVYLNEVKTPLKSVFGYQVPVAENYYETTGANAHYTDPLGMYVYPNDMHDAGLAFDKGAYQVSAYGLKALSTDPMRFGMKGNTTQDGDSWAIFTRFKLIFRAKNSAIMSQMLDEQLAKFNVDKLMGSEVRARALNLVAEANAAIEAADGEAMFNVIAKLGAYSDTIDASVALFEELVKAKLDLEDKISVYSSTARESAKSAAAALFAEVDGAITAKTYTDAQATAAIEDIKKAIVAMKIPQTVDGDVTLDAPVELTQLIESPSFENEEGNGTTEGWTMSTTGAINFTAYEFFQKTFDVYQDLGGLPAGTYRLKVNAFQRVGNAIQDNGDSASVNQAVMYAKLADEREFTQDIKHVNYHKFTADEREFYNGTWTEVYDYNVEGNDTVSIDTLFVTNNMEGAEDKFQQGMYENNLVFQMPAEGSLRIGVRRDVCPANGWFIMDMWELWYYKDIDPAQVIATGIEAVGEEQPVRVEFFNLAGQQMRSKTSGVAIARMIDAQGRVTVKKVIVK